MKGRIFLGRYEVIRQLGEGGMGVVYLAKQLDLARQVVVKVMHPHVAADPKFCDRFQRETLLMARLQHPYAVTLIDASLNDPDGPCIVMEYVRGVSLDVLLEKNGRLNPGRVGRLLGQVCEVLQTAHDLGIVHRDLKPANLMIANPDTPRETVKVMDFGLAKLVETEALKKVTDTNVEFAVGTPAYISPEQIRGEEMDHRGDLYSIGVILYELLSGQLPFPGPSSMDMMLAHATEPPPSFQETEAAGLIPSSIESLVFDCMAKDPEGRPQCARDLAERYETALAHREAEAQAAAAPRRRPSPANGVPMAEEAHSVGLMVEDPSALSYQMEAWMPERIALVKLRGFVHDTGGEVVESVPGLIRVRFGRRGSSRGSTPLSLSWLGFGRKASSSLDVELRMAPMEHTRSSAIMIQVVFRPHPPSLRNNPDWCQRCMQVFVELRSYLMGA